MKRYVVFMPKLDFFKYPYMDLFNRNNIEVFEFWPYVPVNSSNKLIKKICDFWFAPERNCKKFRMPFHNLWYKYLTCIPDSDDEIVFMFFESYIQCTPQYRRYLKKHFPNCKITCTLFDLAKWHLEETNDMKFMKEFADAVFSYDIDDVEKYDLVFHRDAFSVLPQELLEGGNIVSDLSFCGKAKDRYDELLGVYELAKRAGVACDFNVPKLPDDAKKKYPELANSKVMPYLEYIKRIQGSNCLLEICQSKKKQYTLRPWEAIAYGKKILTSNTEFLNEEFYDPRYIQVYEKPEDIDWDWVKEKIEVDYKYVDKLSIDLFLSDYDKVLSER